MTAHTPLDALLRGKVGAWLGTAAAVAVISAGSVPFVGAAVAQESTPEPSATAEATPEPAQSPTAEAASAPAEPTGAATKEPTAAAPAPVPYLVTFVAGTNAAQQDDALADAGATEVSAVPQLRLRAVTVPSGDTTAVEALRKDSRVSRVEGDAVREAESAPDDPRYAEQWALPIIGWDTAHAAGAAAGSATVAVLDTGVDGSDADLAGQLVAGTSTLDDSDGLTDPNGHGTAMASIVAAGTDNGTGIAGVGFSGVKVMPVTVLDAEGLGQDSDIVEGVVWAADSGADVILMSFSNPGYSFALQAAVDYAWSKGAVLVAATGNESSTTVTYPAGTAKVMGVAATTRDDVLWTGSNSGATVFLAAPGVDVANSAGSTTGTSASAAIVAAAAAQLAASDSAASNGVIVGRLARNADAVEGAGNGRVNLARSLEDTSTAAVVPAGQVNGATGPFVGPYKAAGTVTGASTSIRASDCTTPQTSFTAGATVCARSTVAVTGGGSTAWRIQWYAPGAASPSLDDPFSETTQGTRAYNTTMAVTATGTWTVLVCKTSNAGPCSSGNREGATTFTVVGNRAPVAVADTASTNEDTAVNGNVLTNDSDADNNPLTAIKVTDPANGTVMLGTNGAFTYVPRLNFSGTDSFTYKANDGTADSNVATVTITVNAVNDAPVAVNDAATTNEDVAVHGNVLTNDTDVDNATLSSVKVTEPANGTVVLGSDGAFTYTPRLNFSGSDSFTYKANDGTLDSNVATVTITVTAVNDAPVAVDDAETTDEDTAVNGDVLANDSDADNNPLTAIKVTDPANGTVMLGTSGAFTYVPRLNFNGTDSFTYKANDGTDDSNLATVTITVNAVNDAPVAVDDTASGAEDSGINGSVLGNDSDIDGDSLTAVKVSEPANGTVVLGSDGTFTYTPRLDFSGSDSFTYKANDGTLDSNVATVTITVTAVNDAPVAVDDAETTDEDTAVNGDVLANDSDVDNTSLTATLVDDVTDGTLTLNSDGTFTYTPDANFNGTDSFTYKANDGTDDSNLATVTITVNAVNDAPVAVDDTASGAEDSGINGSVLGNDSDIDGDSLTAVKVSEPANGTVVLGSDGTFTYTPRLDFSGSDSFTYKANDGTLDSNVATVTITVTAVNDAPVAVDDAETTDEDTAVNGDVLANDSDVDNTSLTATLVDDVTDGTLTLNSDGTFTYTPDANFNGTDSFTYKANDGTDDSNLATVTITVNAVNDAPVAVDDTASGAEDSGINGSVLGNDSDIDGDSLTAVKVSEPANGTVVLGSDGTFTYVPELDFNGTDSFTYKANDGTLDSNVATVTITVTAVNDAPVAVDDAETTDEDTAVNGDVLANDSDVDNTSLTATLVDDVTDGTLTLNSDGTFTYTPDANFNGTDSFTYKANDGTDDSNLATVTITVNAVNDAPVAVDDTASGAEDSGINGSVLGNDSDIDGDSLTAVKVSEPANGTVVLGSDGTFTYVPELDFNGTDSFTYKANDGTLDSNVATVTITVTAVNDAPVAVDDAETTDEDTAVNGDVLANDSDVDNTSLTATLVDDVTDGTLTLNSDGTFTYTPDANFNGTDSFTYKANDGTDDSNLATVTITVNAVNDAPVAVDDTASGAEDSGINGSVLGNDSDIDGDSLTAVKVSEPANGTVVLGSDGTFTYVPELDFNGTDSFTYKANDGTLDSNVATVTITVTAVNDAPVAVDDAETTDEDTAVNGDVLANDSDVDNTSLTATLVDDVTDGTLTLNSDGTFTYTPDANFNGTDSFTYKANDGTDDSNLATVTITVNAVNDAPVAVDDTASGAEDSGINGSVLGNDSDIDGDSLTAVKVSEPANGTVVLGSDGTFTYVPELDFNGTDSFTYKANDGTLDSNVATVTITVTAVNDAPVVRNNLATQTVQFSDAIAPLSFSATDVDHDASALEATTSWKAAGATLFTAGALAGLSLTPTGSPSASPRTWQLSGRALVPAGVYTVRVDVSDATDSGISDVTIEVTHEDALIEYTGDTLKSTGSTTLTSTTALTMAAVIRESADGALGDQLAGKGILFSAYKFTDTAMAAPVASCTATITRTGAGIGTATCELAPRLAADNYLVKTQLATNGFYTAPVETQAATVVLAGTGMTTGGGWISDAHGTRSNLGFTVKYLKNGNVQGNSLYIYRRTLSEPTVINGTTLPAGVYNWIIKSNAMSGLTQKCTTSTPKVCTATFTGKSNVTAINRTTGAAYGLGGNYNFQVDLTDNGEPGAGSATASDKYAIRVWDTTAGTYYQLGTPAQQASLGGGNLQVRL